MLLHMMNPKQEEVDLVSQLFRVNEIEVWKMNTWG
jgi:hypothetical protein